MPTKLPIVGKMNLISGWCWFSWTNYSWLRYFYAPGLKGLLGASSNRIVRLSVCPSVCPLFRPAYKVQKLKFWWWYSNLTGIVSSLKGSSHLTDIPCLWGGAGSKCRTWDFGHILTLLPPGHGCFTNTCLVMPPFEEGGAYCVAHVGRYVGRSVGLSVSLNLVQLITQERFPPEASNLVGR